VQFLDYFKTSLRGANFDSQRSFNSYFFFFDCIGESAWPGTPPRRLAQLEHTAATTRLELGRRVEEEADMMHSGMNGGGGHGGGDKSASAVEDISPTKIPTPGGKAASLIVGQHSPRARASPQPSPSSSQGQQGTTPNHSTRRETEIDA